MADYPRAEPVPSLPEKSISFYHPAYAATALLEFCCCDGRGTGFHYRTALAACSIVACNRAGFLTEVEGGPPIVQADDSLLTGDKYFYYAFGGSTSAEADEAGAVAGDAAAAAAAERDGDYPICPSFSHWRFPHGALPLPWPDNHCTSVVGPRLPSKMGEATSERDNGCVVTAHGDWTQRAHLVPQALSKWFIREMMKQYVEFPNKDCGIDATANSVMLCYDMHKALDHHYWAPVPKGGGGDGGSSDTVWVAQFVKTTKNLGYQHHGRELRISPGVAPQLLFARFALLVLGRLTTFLEYYCDKGVMAVVVEGDARPELNVVPLTSGIVSAIFRQPNRATPNAPSGPRSKKRSRQQSQRGGQPNDSGSPESAHAFLAYDSNDDDGIDGVHSTANSDGDAPPRSAVSEAGHGEETAMDIIFFGSSPSIFGKLHGPCQSIDEPPSNACAAKRRRRSSSWYSCDGSAKRARLDISEVMRKLGYLEKAQKLNERWGWK